MDRPGGVTGIVAEDNRYRYAERAIARRIFIVCWIVFALHFATNTVREIFPAITLADHFSFDVSEYSGLHHDVFEIPGRGTFINNNPGASILAAVPYFLLKPVTDRIVERVQFVRASEQQREPPKFDTIYPLAQEFYARSRERGLDVKFGIAAGIMQSLVMAPIGALGAVVMFWILLSLTRDRRAAALLSLLYAFATPIFFRTAQLNQNVLIASFALFSFALLWKPWPSATSRKPGFLLAGLCCGWTVVLDYSGVVAVCVISCYAISIWYSEASDDRTVADIAKFFGGVAACAVVLMAYQWNAFGNPILPAQSYMPAANYTEMGYRGFSIPQPDLLYETAFGLKYGLFTSAPLLLLAFVVPIWVRQSTRLLRERELAFILAFIVCFFLFCAANQYGRMQFNTGVRHIVPVVPFLFLLAANVLLHIPRNAAALIGVIATYWSWCLAMYRDVEQGWGVIESVKHITLEGFRLPWLTTLERMGFVTDASPLPLFLLAGAVIWVLWASNSKNPEVAVS
jgi:hypothetical protein